jgi:hypothetical protein
MSFVTILLVYTGSAKTSRFATCPFLGTFFPPIASKQGPQVLHSGRKMPLVREWFAPEFIIENGESTTLQAGVLFL